MQNIDPAVCYFNRERCETFQKTSEVKCISYVLCVLYDIKLTCAERYGSHSDVHFVQNT